MKNRAPAAASVFVVEDAAAIRRRLVAMLGEIEGVSVVGEAQSADEAVAGILDTRPDSVLLDLQLARGTGFDVLRQVRGLVPRAVFIVLTSHGGPQYRERSLATGADHFIDKSDVQQVRQLIAEQAAAE